MSSKQSFMSGIAAKISAMLLVLGALIVAALVTSVSIFGDFSRSLDTYQDELVPQLRESSGMVETAGNLGEGLSNLLIAGNADELAASAGEIRSEIEALRAGVATLGEEVAGSVAGDIATIVENVTLVESARKDDIEYDIATLDGSDDLSSAVSAAAARLAGMSSEALDGVLARSQATIGETRGTLGFIGTATALERAVKTLQSVVLTGASADDAAGVAEAQAEATELAQGIGALAGDLSLDGELTGLLERILSHADPEDGILAARAVVIEARGTADAASRMVSASISAITSAARGLGHAAVGEIASGSVALEQSADGGRSVMTLIGAVALLVLVLTPLGAIRFIVRPLVAVTRVTERLALGDTAPVEGFEKQGGEIGRMAAALKVFRDNMIERSRLEKEERERAIAAQRREAEESLRAAEETRAREEAERKKAWEQAEAERAREAREARARDELREREEAQRRAIAEEQDQVVQELARGLKSLAEGDLQFRIETRFPEAYEALRHNFNDTVSTLSDVIAQIAESAEHIDANSSEIASASTDLAHRTEQQAASLEETAAAIEELTTSVRAAAQHADKIDGDVATTRRNAEESGRVVHDAVGAMSEIERSSGQISQIVGVIDTIAFQTNLLALNAGVEAARAGDAGRGFAVVASEVRALAQRSSDAAREIKELIATSSGHVERGVDLVRRTGTSLETIVDAIANVTDLVSGIASSIREQSHGLVEINTSVNQLDRVTQQNAAMVEEATAASNEMRNEARSLAGLFARFKIAPAAKKPAQRNHRPPARAAKSAATATPASPPLVKPGPVPARKAAASGGSAAVALDDDDWTEF